MVIMLKGVDYKIIYVMIDLGLCIFIKLPSDSDTKKSLRTTVLWFMSALPFFWFSKLSQ